MTGGICVRGGVFLLQTLLDGCSWCAVHSQHSVPLSVPYTMLIGRIAFAYYDKTATNAVYFTVTKHGGHLVMWAKVKACT